MPIYDGHRCPGSFTQNANTPTELLVCTYSAKWSRAPDSWGNLCCPLQCPLRLGLNFTRSPAIPMRDISIICTTWPMQTRHTNYSWLSIYLTHPYVRQYSFCIISHSVRNIHIFYMMRAYIQRGAFIRAQLRMPVLISYVCDGHRCTPHSLE